MVSFFALWSISTAEGRPISVNEFRVVDGDTIHLLSEDKATRRVGYNAPETTARPGELLGGIAARLYEWPMEFDVTRFKSLAIALQELAPFIRSGQHLLTGATFAQFGKLRSRELLANWLLCAAADTFTADHRFAFTTDPLGGDGVIVDELTGETWPTEHVLAYPGPGQPAPADGNAFLLKMIMHKHGRGAGYATGRTLVVLAENMGSWNPTTLARMLPDPLLFDAVWVVGLHTADTAGYHYDVARLDLSRGVAPVWRVDIAPDFASWTVSPAG